MSLVLNRDDLAQCRALLRNGSKSFFAASLLLPRHVREPATALYAFCRVADDAVDLTDRPGEALAVLHGRLDGVYSGRPQDNPVDRALAAVVQSYGLPRAHLDALLDGFLWDSEGKRYATIGDLRAYAARVAGTVGVMMTLLMGERAPVTLARACDLGIAMQLTNIARDVGEDARAGRLYLPEAWLMEAGLDPQSWLRAPVFDSRIAGIIEHLLAEAAVLYERSKDGIALLPPDCRPAIHAARLIYAEIGAEVARAGHDSVSRRAVVAGNRKLRLLAEALLSGAQTSGQPHAMLEEARFLVEAVEPDPQAVASHPGRVGRIIDIMDKLERGKREAWVLSSPA
jgi:15-cis-phytoene synthase